MDIKGSVDALFCLLTLFLRIFYVLQEAARIFGLGKETAFHKACTDDYIELLKDQEVRCSGTKFRFIRELHLLT